eukprot:TRINITY_DN2222_c0_g1_i1.p1 TRINITY_DN2222_c0_g1~~TRINITY_DN2222_c0_g1_i1.p1  ORF type:complete len:1548 (+),score=600.21 TRINITY_DN2222_c0_g1_i1:54-4697(+)
MAEAAAAGGSDSIKVLVRVRPFNQMELKDPQGSQAAFTLQAPCTLQCGDDTSGKKVRSYDYVFASDPAGRCFGTQEDVFRQVGMPLLENAMHSYNGCLFAYGQTGSGKSHSVLGDATSEEHKGILPRSCEHLFELLEREKIERKGAFTSDVRATYLEIYNERIGDLLVTKTVRDLVVRVHPTLGPNVPGLTEAPVASYADVNELLNFGAKNRIIAATNMNAQSSRSHAIFSIDIRMTRDGKDSQSRIHFVDLAGSERQKKTGAAGDRLKEGIGINQSLTVLGKVISSLTSGKKGEVPPFRESKLTLLLKEALSGNSKTVLVACVSPSLFNFDETTSTLDFATRCKLIKTSAKKNEVDRRDQIEALEAEKAAMEAQLKSEQEARAAVMGLVDQEKARVAALQDEMEGIREQLAKARVEEAAAEQERIAAEREQAAEELKDAKTALAASKALSQKEKDEALARLDAEMAEKEAIRKEREVALEKVNEAERERERIAEEREQAQREFEEQRKKWSEAEEANKQQMAASLQVMEAELATKEALRKEREDALEKMVAEKAEKEKLLQREAEEAERRRTELEDMKRVLEESKATSSHESQEKATALAKLEMEIAAKEAIRKEREEALEQAKRVEQERQALLAERQREREELEDSKARLQHAEEERQREIQEALKTLEAEQAEKDALAKERAEALENLAKEQAEKEVILRKNADEAEQQRREAQKAQAERNEAMLELEKVRQSSDQRTQELMKEREAKVAMEMEKQDMQRRLEELRAQEKENELRMAQEFERSLNERILEQEKTDKEMQARVADLQDRLESLSVVSKKELESKADEQRHERLKMLEEFGYGPAAHLSEEERAACPRLLNLNADDSLTGKLVFYLPTQDDDKGFMLGADPSRCEIRIEGLNIGPEMCLLRNEGNKSIFVTALKGALVRVNGVKLQTEGDRSKAKRLQDGDRLTIGQAYIFKVEVPSAKKSGETGKAKVEEDFTKAMEEIDACADVDPRWSNGVNAAMHLVRREFGTEVANELLKEAGRASEKLKLANTVLKDMPKAWRRDVEAFDLSVLFDTRGLPIITVVARRFPKDDAPPARDPETMKRRASAILERRDSFLPPPRMRDGSEHAAIWSFQQFECERLPLMLEVHDDIKALQGRGRFGELLRQEARKAPSFEDWQSLLLADSIEALSMVREAQERQMNVEDDEVASNAMPPDETNETNASGAWGFSGVLAWAQQKMADSPQSPLRRTVHDATNFAEWGTDVTAKLAESKDNIVGKTKDFGKNLLGVFKGAAMMAGARAHSMGRAGAKSAVAKDVASGNVRAKSAARIKDEKIVTTTRVPAPAPAPAVAAAVDRRVSNTSSGSGSTAAGRSSSRPGASKEKRSSLMVPGATSGPGSRTPEDRSKSPASKARTPSPKAGKIARVKSLAQGAQAGAQSNVQAGAQSSGDGEADSQPQAPAEQLASTMRRKKSNPSSTGSGSDEAPTRKAKVEICKQRMSAIMEFDEFGDGLVVPETIPEGSEEPQKEPPAKAKVKTSTEAMDAMERTKSLKAFLDKE